MESNDNLTVPCKPFLVISLDFELFWGMRDVASIRSYGKNILGVREAVPEILSVFRKYNMSATWATVGFITFENKRDLLNYIPDVLPDYMEDKFNPYVDISQIGDNERSDPYHYAYSLVRMIQDTPRMEIGSHTFSHFYCLEERKNKTAFRADLEACNVAMDRLGINTKSLVFPRNQYDESHIADAQTQGFTVFRGNENTKIYAPRPYKGESVMSRFIRLSDSYVDITGPNYSVPKTDPLGITNLPASRFLRPTGNSVFELLRKKRICQAMTSAAINGTGFHLWWHPHNFGTNLTSNINFLVDIFEHFLFLQDKYGMVSLSMGDFSVET